VEVRDGSGTVSAEASFSDSGGSFSCALTVAGGVKCWGSGALGSLGNGSFQDSATPVDVIDGTEIDGTGVPKLLTGVAQITVGTYHACALTTAGGVKCWGSNWSGELGNGTFALESPGGLAMAGDVMDGSLALTGVAQISAGGYHTCAVTTGGGVKCWGNNTNGQLGNGTVGGVATPVDVIEGSPRLPLTGVAQISAGGLHTCAVTAGGAAKCWGRNVSGQLGVGLDVGQSRPADLIPVAANVKEMSSGFAQISAGFEHTCALTTAGGVKCWGRNSYGQAGNGTFTAREVVPIDVIDGSTSIVLGGVTQISAGGWHTCALTTGGGGECWGLNDSGQLGDGTFTSSATPGDVSELPSGAAALWDNEPISIVLPWTFSGFYHPVEMGGVWNTVKGGSTVPIKFQVFAGATELTDSSIVVQPLTATQAACSGGATDTIELAPTGGTNLRYGGGHFIFNWKTPKMPGYCYTITVALTNGASLSANFELR
jgi:alpha-tubulin suppressor-like RCC1 family protein